MKNRYEIYREQNIPQARKTIVRGFENYSDAAQCLAGCYGPDLVYRLFEGLRLISAKFFDFKDKTYRVNSPNIKY